MQFVNRMITAVTISAQLVDGPYGRSLNLQTYTGSDPNSPLLSFGGTLKLIGSLGKLLTLYDLVPNFQAFVPFFFRARQLQVVDMVQSSATKS